MNHNTFLLLKKLTKANIYSVQRNLFFITLTCVIENCQVISDGGSFKKTVVTSGYRYYFIYYIFILGHFQRHNAAKYV